MEQGPCRPETLEPRRTRFSWKKRPKRAPSRGEGNVYHISALRQACFLGCWRRMAGNIVGRRSENCQSRDFERQKPHITQLTCSCARQGRQEVHSHANNPWEVKLARPIETPPSPDFRASGSLWKALLPALCPTDGRTLLLGARDALAPKVDCPTGPFA